MAIPESEYISWIGPNADYLRDTTNFRKWGQLTNGLKDYIDQRFNDLNDGTYNPTLSNMAIPSDQLIQWDENQYLNTVDTFDIWRKKTNGLKVYIDNYFLADVNTIKIYMMVEKFNGDEYTVRINKIETPIPNSLSFTLITKLENESNDESYRFYANAYKDSFVPFNSAILNRLRTNDKSIDLVSLKVYYNNIYVKTFNIGWRFYTDEGTDDGTSKAFTITDTNPGGERMKYSTMQSLNLGNGHAYAWISLYTNNLQVVV